AGPVRRRSVRGTREDESDFRGAGEPAGRFRNACRASGCGGEAWVLPAHAPRILVCAGGVGFGRTTPSMEDCAGGQEKVSQVSAIDGARRAGYICPSAAVCRDSSSLAWVR